MSTLRDDLPQLKTESLIHDGHEVVVEHGSGNVFSDLGLPDAAEHMRKARAVQIIDQIVRDERLSQAEAATRMGITQPALANLLRGQYRGISLEKLLDGAAALGCRVDIHLTLTSGPRGQVRIFNETSG